MANTQDYISLDERIMKVMEEIEREIYENSGAKSSEIRVSSSYVRKKLRESGCLSFSSRVIALVVSQYGWEAEYPNRGEVYLVKRRER